MEWWEAEVCGWTPTRAIFTARGLRHSLLKEGD